MNIRPSKVPRRLREGHVITCVKMNSMDPRLVEIAASYGLDCIWLDAEHTATDWLVLESQIRAVKVHGTGPWSSLGRFQNIILGLFGLCETRHG